MGAEVLGMVVETRQGIFCIDPEDQFVSKFLLERGEYGQDDIRRIGDFLSPSSKVLLLGAHLGSLLVPLSKRVDSIVGVEANPRTFKRLRLNVLMNRCDNVRLFDCAASDSPGSIEFVMNTHNSGGSKRMPLVKNEIYFYDKPEVTRVPSVAIDELLPDELFDLVFMDIEGSELFAMRGMPRILAAAKVVFAEFFPLMVKEVAGATVEQFLQPLQSFNTLVIPSLRKAAHKEDFHAALQDMFDRNHCDDGIIFLKDRLEIRFV